MFFINEVHQDLTKRDDIRKAINRNILDDEKPVKFGLYQVRCSVSDGQMRLFFWSVLIDVFTDDFEREFQVINKAFNKSRETEEPILGHLNRIPLRPDPNFFDRKHPSGGKRPKYLVQQHGSVGFTVDLDN